MIISQKTEGLFWAKVNKTDNCWLWTAAKFANGYAAFHVDRKLRHAHRVSFIIANGSIPDGMHICHACDVRDCVNPAHLFAGTRSDNMRDMVAKGRGITPPQTLVTHCKNGHEYTPENTYQAKNGRYCKACNRVSGNAYAGRKRLAKAQHGVT